MVIVVPAKLERFKGDFEIALPQDASQHEKDYCARIQNILEKFAGDDSQDISSGKFVAHKLEARQQARKAAADDLRREAEEVAKGALSIVIAFDNALVTKGEYLANCGRVEQSLFRVQEKKGEQGKFAVDVDIQLIEGLPPPDDTPSLEKQELYVLVASTMTVINTVCYNMREQRKLTHVRKEKQLQRADILQDTYVKKLTGIARVGLEGAFTGLAKAAIGELRNEFVAQQAGRIKNDYVRRLGTVAATATAITLGAYAFIVQCSNQQNWWSIHRMFLLAAAGAAIGTWMSFSIRRVQIGFNDLAMLEDDLLDPSLRVLFVIGLTTMACLLFWTGVMNIEIGTLKTDVAGFGRKGSIALLIGLFCGLSERALASAVSARAATFVRGIGT